MDEKNFKTLTLHSSFDEIRRLEPYIDDLQKWAHFCDDDYSRIRLAVNEAVTNAVVHGNKEDPSRMIKVKATLAANNLIISVQDEGTGFDPSALQNPLEKENLLNQSGRGLFIIQQYCDRLKFADGATRLIMEFSLE